jgi:dTDP-4-dehydrorhamnose 3,5-epimerase
MTLRFDIMPTPLVGLKLCIRQRVVDERGQFERMFCSRELWEAGFTAPLAQSNLSVTTTMGTVRGMHFQRPPSREMKLVSCINGSIFDVAIDLRRGSKTFLKWYGVELSADNRKAMLVPAGFAHGFQALSENASLIYYHTAPYDHAIEGGLDALDPTLGIMWPLKIALRSSRDSAFERVTNAFEGLDT